MILKFRRSETPWEVVENKSVDPVPIYYENDDLDILSVGDADTHGTYIFDMKDAQRSQGFRDAVLFARQQLLQVNAKKGFNLLLLESWSFTLYRRGKQHRVEVQYSGRPALSKSPSCRAPPFLGVLG